MSHRASASAPLSFVPLILVLLGACVTGRSSRATPAHVAGAGTGARPDADERIALVARVGGWPLCELIATIATRTGATIEPAESADPKALDEAVEVVGTIHLPRDRALEWLQAVLAYHRLVMVPLGTPDEASYAVLQVSDTYLCR